MPGVCAWMPQLPQAVLAALAGSSGGGGGSGKPLEQTGVRRLYVPPQRLHILRCRAKSGSSSGITAFVSSSGTSIAKHSSGSTASSSNGNGARPPVQRVPRIPPLPYWCDGVAVIGLPKEELVFCFQTPTQAAATIRKQLRPEAQYGGTAVKLAFLPADKAQAILDRWQYAAAQQELQALDAKPKLWWQYDSAVKGLAKEAAAAAGVPTESGASIAGEAETLTRKQRRRAAKLAKAAAATAAEAERRQRRQRASAATAAAGIDAGSSASNLASSSSIDSDSDSDSASPSLGSIGEQQPVAATDRQEEPAAGNAPLQLADSAFLFRWKSVMVRGQPDGSTIFAFKGLEPLPGPEPSSAPLPGSHSDGLSDTDGDGSSSSDLGGGVRFGRGLEWQQQQLLPSLEGVAWSNALRLGVASSRQISRSLDKLQTFVREWEQHQDSSVGFDDQLHRPYENAQARAAKRAAQLQLRSEEASSDEEGDELGVRQAIEQRQVIEQRRREQQQQEDEQQWARGHRQGERPQEQRQQQQQQQLPELQSEWAKQQQAAGAEHVMASLAIATVGSSSSSSDDEAGARPVAAAGSAQDWQEELVPWVERPATLAELKPAEQAPGNTGGPSDAGTTQREPWPLGALVGLIAASAAWAAMAVRRLASQVASVCARAVLALFRLLPVAFRRLFWPAWPPKWSEAHVSPTLAGLLSADPSSPPSARHAAQRAAGFDPQGRTSAPLADLQGWQVERLTLCPAGNLDLYRAAFTHKSALLLGERVQKSFERLEFLGDSVLGVTCRTLLMQRLPTSDEGEMTKLQGRLLSGAAAARYAAWLGLDRYVLMELRGLREAAQHTPAILADVFEALLGALYLDQGFEAAHRFCLRVLEANTDWRELEATEDWKGLLSRCAAMQNRPQPRFIVRATSQREFKAGLALKYWSVDVHYRGGVKGSGGGFNKRDAEQAAARQALQQMGEVP